ncbi:outer membrane lipoprotein-sorting protein [Mariprofundus ferrooxydans]|nr:outer membrane lipoprotein-sorting protein [Mariprofundus ferrooxydans]
MALFVMQQTPAWAAGVTLKQMTDNHSHRLAGLTGAEIIMESLKRHELYPYVYEEQTLVMTDARQHHDVRRLLRYSRMEKEGTFKAMIKFIYPETIAGSVLLFTRQLDGRRNSRIYLPALGMKPIAYVGGVEGGQMLGSEFSVEDLMPEDMRDFVYHRDNDIVDGNVLYFVVQAVSFDVKHARRTYSARTMLIRQDNFFVTRIDYLNSQGRLLKRQTRHDMHQVSGKMWRADMIIVENYQNHYRSTLKIDRRVYSSDYVPESMFDVSLFVPRKVVSHKAVPTDASLASEHEPAVLKQGGGQ